MAKKKYSYNDRVEYHEKRCKSFLEKFQTNTDLGEITHWYSYLEAEKKNPKIQYSNGYTTFSSNIAVGHLRSESEFKRETKAFKRGFRAAKAAYEKSKNIKF